MLLIRTLRDPQPPPTIRRRSAVRGVRACVHACSNRFFYRALARLTANLLRQMAANGFSRYVRVQDEDGTMWTATVCSSCTHAHYNRTIFGWCRPIFVGKLSAVFVGPVLADGATRTRASFTRPPVGRRGSNRSRRRRRVVGSEFQWFPTFNYVYRRRRCRHVRYDILRCVPCTKFHIVFTIYLSGAFVRLLSPKYDRFHTVVVHNPFLRPYVYCI